jgi:tetratricopeptide (TPR) repeat protein
MEYGEGMGECSYEGLHPLHPITYSSKKRYKCGSSNLEERDRFFILLFLCAFALIVTLKFTRRTIMKAPKIIVPITIFLAVGVAAIASPVKANENARYYLSECYRNQHELKDYQSSEAACDQAIKLKPEYAEAYLFRGGARLHLENYQGADADFNRASDLFRKQKNTEGYQNAQKLLEILHDFQRKSRGSNQNR